MPERLDFFVPNCAFCRHDGLLSQFYIVRNWKNQDCFSTKFELIISSDDIFDLFVRIMVTEDKCCFTPPNCPAIWKRSRFTEDVVFLKFLKDSLKVCFFADHHRAIRESFFKKFRRVKVIWLQTKYVFSAVRLCFWALIVLVEIFVFPNIYED